MGLGGRRADEEDLEWVVLADLPDSGAAEQGSVLGEAMCEWFQQNPVWTADGGTRLLLVDLDNLRAAPGRWKARMTVAVWLARRADHVLLAGQHSALARAQPHLADMAEHAVGVDDGSDLADHVLLEGAVRVAAEQPDGEPLQVVVLSNDGIFAQLTDHGPLVVVSPGGHALSDRLREASDRLVDLPELEDALESRR